MLNDEIRGRARDLGCCSHRLPPRARPGRDGSQRQVAESLFRKATGDGSQAVTAAIFWLKTRARWKEPTLEAAMRLSTDDTITGLLHRIASHGRKLHDPG